MRRRPLRVRSAGVAALLALGAAPLSARQDPAQGDVPLPRADGWRASLVLDTGDAGVWTVGAFPVFEQYASDEVVALDDEGRCHVLVSYSGKWTPFPRVHDGSWLGGLARGDVDPRVDGPELYVGGESGNVYQLVPYAHGGLDARLVAHFAGRQVHTLVAGELDPSNDTPELLVFTEPGSLARVTPTAPHGRFEVQELGPTTGRVRDAVAIETDGGTRIVTAGREGRLGLLELSADGPRWGEIHREPMGMGRVTRRRGSAGPLVLYSTLDDGRVLRHERGADGWRTETIFAGPQGPRGIASGRFHEDPTVETVAVFGYSRRVELLTRGPDGHWSAETIFEDRDRGHGLAVAELDGRNATDELLGCGYGARVFLLARPPGYGRPGLATSPDEPPRHPEPDAVPSPPND